MAKISTYPHASSPQLSDMLIGSEVGDGNATKNFLISDIIGLANLGQYVPYTGATANVDITGYTFTADSATLNNGFSVLAGLSEFYGAIQVIGSIALDAQLIDGLGSPGTLGQVLTTNGSGTSWATYGLQEVLDANNTATQDIYLTGDIALTGDFTAQDITSTGTLWVYGALKDGAGSLGTSGQVLKSTGAGHVVWANETNSLKYGVFYDDTTQICVTGTPVAMKFNNTVDADGVFIGADGLGNMWYIQVNQKGTYNIQFSAQIERITGGGDEKVDIWFRLEGVDLPWSNTQLTMKANSNYVVASWNIIADIDVAERFQIMWHQTGGSIRLTASAPQTAPVRPGTPSTILTVTQVS